MLYLFYPDFCQWSLPSSHSGSGLSHSHPKPWGNTCHYWVICLVYLKITFINVQSSISISMFVITESLPWLSSVVFNHTFSSSSPSSKLNGFVPLLLLPLQNLPARRPKRSPKLIVMYQIFLKLIRILENKLKRKSWSKSNWSSCVPSQVPMKSVCCHMYRSWSSQGIPLTFLHVPRTEVTRK